jgi:phosphatidylinositol glycan class K
MRAVLLLLCILGMVLSGFEENYRNNWYVIVNTSKFYFNYRHTANALGLYKYLKDSGI